MSGAGGVPLGKDIGPAGAALLGGTPAKSIMRFAGVNTMDEYERAQAKEVQPSANSQKRRKKGGDLWEERTRVKNQARALYVQGKSKMLQGFTEQSNNKRRLFVCQQIDLSERQCESTGRDESCAVTKKKCI